MIVLFPACDTFQTEKKTRIAVGFSQVRGRSIKNTSQVKRKRAIEKYPRGGLKQPG